jgi:hypothetical protein
MTSFKQFQIAQKHSKGQATIQPIQPFWILVVGRGKADLNRIKQNRKVGS